MRIREEKNFFLITKCKFFKKPVRRFFFFIFMHKITYKSVSVRIYRNIQAKFDSLPQNQSFAQSTLYKKKQLENFL